MAHGDEVRHCINAECGRPFWLSRVGDAPVSERETIDLPSLQSRMRP